MFTLLQAPGELTATHRSVGAKPESLTRAVSILLQGIALNGFQYDPAALATFQVSIRNLHEGLDPLADDNTALLMAGAAIRLLEDHNDAAARHLELRHNEMEAVIALLSETVLKVCGASPEEMLQAREIERDIASATRIEGIVAARARLAAFLVTLRERTA